jgi:O-antigen/teichoic acid export membrane protein
MKPLLEWYLSSNASRVRRALSDTRSSTTTRATFRTAFVNLAIAGMGAAGGLMLAAGLGAEARGHLAVVLIWPSVIGTLSAVGLPQATCFAISKWQKEAGRITMTAMSISFTVALVVAVVGILLAPAIGDTAEVTTGLRIVFAFTPIYFIPGILIAALQALDNRAWNLVRLAQPGVYFGGIAVALGTGRLTVSIAIAIYVSSLTVQLLLSAVVAVHRIDRPLSAVRAWVPRLLSYGLRSVAAIAPSEINARFDQMLLSLTVSPAALGNYAAAVSLSTTAYPISSAFGNVAFPRIAASQDASEVRRIEKLAISGSLASATIILVPLGLVASWLIPALFGSDYRQAILPFLILIPGSVLLVTNRVMGDLLRGRGQPTIPAAAELSGAVVTVVLLAALVPKLGIKGAAIASVVAYAVAAAVLAKGLRSPVKYDET